MIWPVTTLALLAFTVVIVWRRRDDSARAWAYRAYLSPALYWGVPALYALAGALVTGPSFGLDMMTPAAQGLAGVGVVSIGIVWLIARKVATPVFEAQGAPHRDRTLVHSFWAMFWLLGILLGLLPAVLRSL